MPDAITTKTANGLSIGLDTEIKMVYPLTTCCEASAKGSVATGVPATVCRACYRDIDPGYGDCVILTEDRDAAIQKISWWILTLEELREVTPEAARAQAELALQDLAAKAGWA